MHKFQKIFLNVTSDLKNYFFHFSFSLSRFFNQIFIINQGQLAIQKELHVFKEFDLSIRGESTNNFQRLLELQYLLESR